MSILRVHTNDTQDSFSFPEGVNLLEFLRTHGYNVTAPCGGFGRCGKCRVLYQTANGQKEVLACQTHLTEDCDVFLSEQQSEITWSPAEKQLFAEGDRNGYGVAVDLGTTTVSISLYDLATGKLSGTVSRWNDQGSFGADVISRIGYCRDHENGLKILSDCIRCQILAMLEQLCEQSNIDIRDISEGFLAGNTVMEHIFAGLSPDSIASAPYQPLSYFDAGQKTELKGIPFYLSPCIAGYVGGDITAGLLNGEVCRPDQNTLFIDVGTNGEIVLNTAGHMTACAVACGPAFEGAGIECGMPAAEGAVSRVSLTEDGLSFEVIGGGRAKGICGSGLLDLISCLLELGCIDESGRLEMEDGSDAFYLTEDVYITQKDVRQLQLAKAAVAAGIERLLQTCGLSCKEIDHLYLAGGFGTRLRPESAIRIGMLPPELEDRITPLGNTALSGASMALLKPSLRNELCRKKEQCAYLELSTDKGFIDCYTDAMSFPERIFYEFI